MIAYLEGKISEIGDSDCILLTGGVGYQITCSNNTLGALIVGKETSLFIHTHVKEDILQLFGFSSKIEKKLFLSLIKVNGIGPKMATQILSGTTIDSICHWIESGDVKALTSLPKVGKKTAEQIILSLKGKLVMGEETSTSSQPRGKRLEIQSALVNLGFKLGDVEKVIGQLEEEVEVEEGIRQSLRTLTTL